MSSIGLITWLLVQQYISVPIKHLDVRQHLFESAPFRAAAVANRTLIPSLCPVADSRLIREKGQYNGGNSTHELACLQRLASQSQEKSYLHAVFSVEHSPFYCILTGDEWPSLMTSQLWWHTRRNTKFSAIGTFFQVKPCTHSSRFCSYAETLRLECPTLQRRIDSMMYQYLGMQADARILYDGHSRKNVASVYRDRLYGAD